jgi:hypothetical protein
MGKKAEVRKSISSWKEGKIQRMKYLENEGCKRK